LDGKLIALDARNGKPVWTVDVAPNYATGYSLTLAPLAIKDKVIIGVAGGEYGIRGFIAAYDAVSGKEAWRLYTVLGPGEPGPDTCPRQQGMGRPPAEVNDVGKPQRQFLCAGPDRR